MTVTLVLYIFMSFNILWSLIRAYQPDGYLGCFEDIYGESLVEHNKEFIHGNNKGDVCKAACKNNTKRYAGTKGLWCYCGNGFVKNRIRSSTECNGSCPRNNSEKCGGKYEMNQYNRISLYDTWLCSVCVTLPCQNGATCTDVSAKRYNCSCSAGWTGRVCNENIATITYTELRSPSTQAIGGSTVAAQPSEIKFAIYIAVPVSIVVLIVFVLIVAVLILRRKPNQNEVGLQATFIHVTSANAAAGDNDHNYDSIDRTGEKDHNYDAICRIGDNDYNYGAFDRTGDNDHNYDGLDRTGDKDHKYVAIDRTGEKDHKFDAIDQTGGDDRNYSNIDQSGRGDRNYSNVDQTGHGDRNYSNADRSDNGSAIQYDDSGYLNLQITA